MDQLLGNFGNSTVLLYSPKTDAHPSVVTGDAVIQNLFYCDDWDMYPSQDASTEDGRVAGHPDRNVFHLDRIKTAGKVSQKMICWADNSPDLVMLKIFESGRHAWSGYAYSSPGDGSGVQGIPGSAFSPTFSFMTGLFGVYSECMLNSIEISASASAEKPHVAVNYDFVYNHLWAEDAPAVNNLMATIDSSSRTALPIRNVFFYDCAVATSLDNQVLATGHDPLGVPSGGSSPFFKGFNTGQIPSNEYISEMKFKLENFLEPNYTMASSLQWGDEPANRKAGLHARLNENFWPNGHYPSKQRLISGSFTWITQYRPNEIMMKIAGGPPAQLYGQDALGQFMGQPLIMIFGPMKIKIMNPIWNLSKPTLMPGKLMKITATFSGATDGELILQPTESY